MQIYGAVLEGIEGRLISVDSDILPDRSGLKVLGAKGMEVREALEKVARVLNATEFGIKEKAGLITIDLRPSDLRIRGETLALPMAIRAYMALMRNPNLNEPPAPPEEGSSDNEIKSFQVKLKEYRKEQNLLRAKLEAMEEDSGDYLLVGGLTLDGRLYPPEKGLMGLISAAGQGFKVIVPDDCAGYTMIAKEMLKKQGKEIEVFLAKTFYEAASIIDNSAKPRRPNEDHIKKLRDYNPSIGGTPDFSEIIGQSKAKFALEIAAAGGHNVLLWGPQGEAKTRLATAVPGILPNLKWDELAEVNKIYTAKGLLGPNEIIRTRPFIEVGSAATMPGLVGGGIIPVPGAISLAHTGVLKIDEFNLVDLRTIEELRVPLEEGFYNITRVSGTSRMPAQFCLIATMNPCKDSYYGEFRCSKCNRVVGDINSRCIEHPGAKTVHQCKCRRESDIRSYQRLPGPILNRIDLRVQVFSVDPYLTEESETSEVIAKRVERAINKQFDRYRGLQGISRNSQINFTHIKRDVIGLSPSAKNTAQWIHRKYRLNMRSYVKLHAVARTIADLKGRSEILDDDIVKAHQVMGKESHELFDLTPIETDIQSVPREDTSRGIEALRALASAIREEMLLSKHTLSGVSKDSGVPRDVISEILDGRVNRITPDARKLFTWIQRRRKAALTKDNS